MDVTGLHLFEGYGIELEYMIVDRVGLSVLPAADAVLRAAAGMVTTEVEMGPLQWSNELALHVIELKTNGPVSSLDGLVQIFDEHVGRINTILAPHGARLMPGAMHPWMDPLRELRLWPHDNSPIYEAYHRIFNCRGHGWSNLQSLHVNLPFHGDGEFGRLHAAVRLLLPIVPALAASSPVMDGRLTGLLDNRLDAYRTNQRAIPSIAGDIIPEPVFTRRDYEERILERIYRDIAPFDPEEILQEEWLNSRGAIARFDRDTIEIRVIDVQECPAADCAVVTAIAAALKALTEERWTPLAELQAWETAPLAALLSTGIRDADDAVIEDPRYLRVFGYPRGRATARELWTHIIEELLPPGSIEPAVERALAVIRDHGPLARRLVQALGPAPDRARLAAVYGRLCDCLEAAEPFLPP